MAKSREQFKAWAKSAGYNEEYYFFTNTHPNHYDDDHIEDMWQAWQASRGAVEIELPEGVSTREALSRGFTCDYAAGMDQGITDCAYKVIEHGLKVKE